MELNAPWEFVSDTVMGGVSEGKLQTEIIAGRKATRLAGEVSLENNGGFIQTAFDINEDGSIFDASAFTAIEIDVLCNAEIYDLRLRTSQLTRPWQSYRASFLAPDKWTTVRILFTEFKPHKTETPFVSRLLRRIGVIEIGRIFSADVAVSAIRILA